MQKSVKKVGIIGAMDVEVQLLLKGLSSVRKTEAGGLAFTEGRLDDTEVVVVRSGIGKVNAALCAQLLVLRYGVTHVINTGIAGAMAAGLRILDFVVSKDALYHDFSVTAFGYEPCVIPQMDCSAFPADAKLREAAKKAFAALPEAQGHSLLEGRIATGDQFISSGAQKDAIRGNCAPACVEMEGAAVAHACHLNRIPFVVIRCMSDMADDQGESTYSFNEDTAAKLSALLVRDMLPLF